MPNSNVIFKKGDSSSSSLPSSTTEGTIYFDENNQSILLDTDTANNTKGRKTFSNWSETAKLSSANTFTENNIFTKSVAIGEGLLTTTSVSVKVSPLVIGKFNTDNTLLKDPLFFVIGNGTSNDDRKDILKITEAMGATFQTNIQVLDNDLLISNGQLTVIGQTSLDELVLKIGSNYYILTPTIDNNNQITFTGQRKI